MIRLTVGRRHLRDAITAVIHQLSFVTGVHSGPRAGKIRVAVGHQRRIGQSTHRDIALAMDETSWRDPHAAAQQFIDLAGEALEETISLRSHFSPLLRHNDPMFTAGDVRRDDMTVVIARHADDGSG